MRELLVGILASLIAAGVTALAPRYLTARSGVLDADIQAESFQEATLVRVTISNPGPVAIQPLSFLCRTEGSVDFAALSTVAGNQLLHPTKDQALWSGVLGARESLTFVAVISHGALDANLKNQFHGKYLALGPRGVREERDATVRPASEAQLARYQRVGGVAVLAIVIVSGVGIGLYIRRRQRTEPKAPPQPGSSPAPRDPKA